ncbi:MAG: hypothetical protein AAFS10_06590, partial [Myxococcota bacterium]
PNGYGGYPHIRWAQLTNRGYIVVDVTPERTQGAWYHYSDITNPDTEPSFAFATSVDTGIPVLKQDNSPAEPPADPPQLAP